MKNKSVLILGNGVSRLQHMDMIREWTGEIWGCNSIYKDLESGLIPRIDAITGDKVAIEAAVDSKEKNGYTYKVWSRGPRTLGMKGTIDIKLATEYIYDSGTTLVCKALIDAYTNIVLVGFDLGGKDIYVPNHEMRNKSAWIARWRKIAKKFTLNNITFVGTDHKPYLLSNKPIDAYAKIYMQDGKNHLTHDYTTVETVSNEVLILGNGISRAAYDKFISRWKKELWVCNEAYCEATTKGYNITRVGSVHPIMIQEAYDFGVIKELDYTLYCNTPVEGLTGKHQFFTMKRGWSTGALSVCQALLEEFDKIHLLGFDFGGPDLYKENDVEGSNFKKQFMEMKRLLPTFKKKVEFIGGKPDFL